MKKLLGILMTVALICLMITTIQTAYANNNETEPVTGDTMIDTTFIAFFGLLLGIVAAVFLPYIRKVYQGSLDASQWSNKYLLVVFSGFIMSVITTFILAPSVLVMSVTEGQAVQGILGLFIVNFGVGFGQTAFIKELFEFGKESKTATPSLPSLPPPIPATVHFNKVLKNVIVNVDGSPYPQTPENGCKVGHFKVITDETSTTVVIAFTDYNVHLVNIVADGQTVYNASLQYAQMKDVKI